ncbi:MAG: hypothetical protein U1E95_01805 [Rubrivivax sp.]
MKASRFSRRLPLTWRSRCSSSRVLADQGLAQPRLALASAAISAQAAGRSAGAEGRKARRDVVAAAAIAREGRRLPPPPR